MRKKRNTLKKVLLIIVILALFIFSSYHPKPKVFEKEFTPVTRLGTIVQIKVISKDEIAAVHAYNAAISAIDDANLIFNSYSDKSEISRAVSEAKNGPVSISIPLYYILDKSLKYSELTDDAFDITISNLSELWKKAQKEGKFPEYHTIADVLANTGSKYIRLTKPEQYSAPSLEITNPNLSINVSAIAKGYITDLAANAMKNIPGVYSGMVNIGGEIVCFNNTPLPDRDYAQKPINTDLDRYNTNYPPDNLFDYPEGMENQTESSPYLESVRQYQEQSTYSEIKTFPIGITDPFEIESSISPESHTWVVYLTNNAIATSGNYRQYFMIENKRFSHIIDPRTGYPAEQASGATVIAPTCLQADALATAFSVMAPEEAIALAESLKDVEAMIVSGSTDSPQILQTTLFESFMHKKQ